VLFGCATSLAACSLLIDSGGLVDPVDPLPDGSTTDGPSTPTGDGSSTGDSSAPVDDSSTPIDSGTDGSSAYAQAVLADQPVAYLRLGDPAGSGFAADERSSLSAMISGEVTAGHPGAIKNDPNGAFHFDGGQVRITRKLAFPNYAPMTIELWVKPRLVDANFRNLVNRVYGNPPNGYQLYIQNSVGVTSERLADGGNDNIYTNVNPTLTGFTHVVVVCDGTSLRGYIDSVEKDVDAMLTRPMLDNDGDLVIGGTSA
jgi:hypothetical protein